MMHERLRLLRGLLNDRGSIFVHLDVHTGPYIKTMMDEVFGRDSFRNEIAWYYYNKMHDSRKKLLRKHSTRSSTTSSRRMLTSSTTHSKKIVMSQFGSSSG